MVRAFLLLNPSVTEVYGLGSLNNTAYHTLRFHIQPRALPISQDLIKIAAEMIASDVFVENSPMANVQLPMQVSVVSKGQSGHLSNVKRQRGGIGSSAYDAKQQDLKGFFASGGVVQNSPRKESKDSSK